MRYREVGGVRFSVIGLGTWQFGSREWGYGSDYADRVSLELVEEALALGINLFDTAEVYGFGRSERILGQALGSHRRNALVATKYAPVLPLRGKGRRHARRSASRLGIEEIDLYQLHFPNPLFSLTAQVAEFEPMLHAGDIRMLGVSNYSLEAWRRVQAAVNFPIWTNQVHLSLFSRRSVREMVPWATANDRLVIAYSPLEQGLLSGRYDIGAKPSNLRRMRREFSDRTLIAFRSVRAVMERIAVNHDATVAQVALAWVLSHESVVAIPGASSVAQLRSNAQAAEMVLTDDEYLDLSEVAERMWPSGSEGR
ncbi:MAG: aldo/keto reductase [Ferrimicrobium sp.]|uniref:Aldo/keto reductase n=1 Tax=Ferrimicrobium acidiphilum TaxID=121039 RepID=A0ABV3Y296_9ACTN|nr:aldo/keto reductase [Ferrimicrobium sp.]